MSITNSVINNIRNSIIAEFKLNNNIPTVYHDDISNCDIINIVLYPNQYKISLSVDMVVIRKIILVDSEVNSKQHTSQFSLKDPIIIDNIIEYMKN